MIKKLKKTIILMFLIVFAIYFFLSYRCLYESVRCSIKYVSLKFKKVLKIEDEGSKNIASEAKVLEANYLKMFNDSDSEYLCLNKSEPTFSFAYLEYLSGNYIVARELFLKVAKNFSKKDIKDYGKYFLFMSIADCSFRLGDVQIGKKYLKRAISYSYTYRMLANLQPHWIRSLFLRYEYYLQKGKRKMNYYLTYNREIILLRRRVYLEKNIDGVKGVFLKKYGKESDKIFKFSLYRFFDERDLKEIVMSEKGKNYVDIDVRSHFKDFENEVIRTRESGIDLKKKYPILETFFYIK